MNRHLPALLPLVLALPAVAHAQAEPTTGSAAACAAVETDAERLACYDRAVQRVAPSTAVVDAMAEAATEVVEAEAAGVDTDSDLYFHDADPRRVAANAGRGSLLDSRWELARDSKLGTFNLRAYKPMYLLPAFWTSDVNALPTASDPSMPAERAPDDSLEAKFQISFKTKALENIFGDNGDLWLGYTQSSRWQVYNTDASRPFRETNYEPEVMLVFRNNYSLGGWKGRMAGVSLNHQSNGRADPVSRSWNRVILNIGLDREDWAVMLRPWVRISDGSDDDNPHIEDYMGRGDVTVVHTRNGHVYSFMGRHSLRGGERSRGAAQFDWGFPISKQLRGHVQVFSGYGESMIDYDHRTTAVGLGISVLEWF
jgi:phospholipase A1